MKYNDKEFKVREENNGEFGTFRYVEKCIDAFKMKNLLLEYKSAKFDRDSCKKMYEKIWDERANGIFKHSLEEENKFYRNFLVADAKVRGIENAIFAFGFNHVEDFEKAIDVAFQKSVK